MVAIVIVILIVILTIVRTIVIIMIIVMVRMPFALRCKTMSVRICAGLQRNWQWSGTGALFLSHFGEFYTACSVS